MFEIFFVNVVPPKNNVVTAEIQREVRDGWYSDDVLRKNAAGMLYAYYFSDGSGTVVILDQGKRVGAYRWANGPQYSDVDHDISKAKSASTDSEIVQKSQTPNANLSPIPEARAMPPTLATDAKPSTGIEIPKPPELNDVRTWQDVSGKFKTEGRFGGMVGAMVTLHKTDGTTSKVQFEQLSDADREWINARRRRDGAPPVSP